MAASPQLTENKVMNCGEGGRRERAKREDQRKKIKMLLHLESPHRHSNWDILGELLVSLLVFSVVEPEAGYISTHNNVPFPNCNMYCITVMYDMYASEEGDNLHGALWHLLYLPCHPHSGATLPFFFSHNKHGPS